MSENLRRFFLLFLVLLSVFLAGRWVWGRLFGMSENGKIEQVLRKAAAAIEAENALAFVEHLTEDFTADHGVERSSVAGELKRFFLMAKEVRVAIEYMKHEVEKLPATATVTRVLLVAKVTGTVEGKSFQGFGPHGADAVLVSLRKEGGIWRIASGQYLDASDPVKAFEELRHTPAGP